MTSLRLVLSVVLFCLIAWEHYLASLVLFVIAAGTDWLDGYFARKYGQVTTLGRILDPFADKVIVCGTFIFLAAIPDIKDVPWGLQPWMVVVIVGRELLVTALRSFIEERGADFSAKMSGKLKMVLQCVAAGVCLFYCYAACSAAGRLGLVGVGHLRLVGGRADGLFGRGLRVCRAAAVAAVLAVMATASRAAAWGSVMHPVTDPSSLVWLGIAGLAVIAASVTIWVVAIVRWSMGLPVVRYQPRRPVPWGGRHVLLMFLLYLALTGVAHVVVYPRLAHGRLPRQRERSDSPGTDPSHCEDGAGGARQPLGAAGGGPGGRGGGAGGRGVLLSRAPAGLAGGGRAAPSPQAAAGCRRLLPGAAPIVLSSLLFAALHFRLAARTPTSRCRPCVIADAIAELLAMAGIILLLRARCGATAVDFGWVPREARRRRGLRVVGLRGGRPCSSIFAVPRAESLGSLLSAGQGGGRSAAAVLLRLGAGDALLSDAPTGAVDRDARRLERHDAGDFVLVSDVERGSKRTGVARARRLRLLVGSPTLIPFLNPEPAPQEMAARPGLRGADQSQSLGRGLPHVLVRVVQCFVQRRRGRAARGPRLPRASAAACLVWGIAAVRPAVSTGTVFAANSAEAG